MEISKVVLYDSQSTDVRNAIQFVYGELIKLAVPVIQAYESDLYHDALWLREHAQGQSFAFNWSVSEGGTTIGHQHDWTGHRKHRYLITLRLDARNRTVVEIDGP